MEARREMLDEGRSGQGGKRDHDPVPDCAAPGELRLRQAVGHASLLQARRTDLGCAVGWPSRMGLLHQRAGETRSDRVLRSPHRPQVLRLEQVCRKGAEAPPALRDNAAGTNSFDEIRPTRRLKVSVRSRD
jgi:hypothetical protein